MQMISRGYFVFSLFLVMVGSVAGRYAGAVIPNDLVAHISESGYTIYFCLIVIGVPLAFANILECKYIWSKFLNHKNIDLLGVNVGFIIGLSRSFFVGY